MAEETAALEADYSEATRGVQLEVASVLADLATSTGALRVGEAGIAQAGETLRVERERFDAGRVTANDLLDAEAALQRETTRRDLAVLDIARARLRLALALGTDPEALLGP
jgi:outer membrane protein TolC